MIYILVTALALILSLNVQLSYGKFIKNMIFDYIYLQFCV